jgi:hypothetical protein
METGPAVWIRVKYGTVDDLKTLIDMDPLVDCSLPGGKDLTSPIHEAIMMGNVAMVDRLCRTGVNMDYKPPSGPSAGKTPAEFARQLRGYARRGNRCDVDCIILRESLFREAYAAQRAHVAKKRQERVELTRNLALAMGGHHRLGGNSWFNALDPELMRMILREGEQNP